MIALKYILFAAVSILINILFQFVSSYIYSGSLSLYLAMVIGTIAGLLSKYSFDKNFIFYLKPQNRINDAKIFLSYAITGVFTTAIFWGIEISFDTLWGGNSKYIGAFLGLCIGYQTKYYLDKKYVFISMEKI